MSQHTRQQRQGMRIRMPRSAPRAHHKRIATPAGRESEQRTQRQTSATQREGEGTSMAGQERRRTQMRRRHYQETTWQKMRPLQDSEEHTRNRSRADTARAEHDARSRRRQRTWTGERHGAAQRSATQSRWDQPRSSGQWAGSTSGGTQACERRQGSGGGYGAKDGDVKAARHHQTERRLTIAEVPVSGERVALPALLLQWPSFQSST